MHPALVKFYNFDLCSSYGAHKPYRGFMPPFGICVVESWQRYIPYANMIYHVFIYMFFSFIYGNLSYQVPHKIT